MEDHVDNTTKLLKFFKRAFYVSLIIISLYAYFNNKVIVLNASAGSQKYRELEEKTNNYKAQAEIEILIEEIDIANPTSGCLGFLDAESKSSSFQLCVARISRNQQYYITGYSIIKDGKGVKFEELSKTDLGNAVSFTIEYNEGIATINVNEENVIEVKTSLNTIIPFVSATSGQVRFEFIK